MGKTTIGKYLAERINYKFFDLDNEVEKFFNKSIECLKSEFLTDYSFTKEAALVLKNIVMNNSNQNCVIALPPSGLKGSYYKIIRKAQCFTIVLRDTPENILSRLTFYDIDSNLIKVRLTELIRSRYLKSIKEDTRYFNKFYKKTDIEVDISGLTIEDSAQKIEALIKNAGMHKGEPLKTDFLV